MTFTRLGPLLFVIAACGSGASDLGNEGPCAVVASEAVTPSDSQVAWLDRSWNSALLRLEPESTTQVVVTTTLLGEVIENRLEKRDDSRIFCPEVRSRGRVRVEVVSDDGYLDEVTEAEFVTSEADGEDVLSRADFLAAELRGGIAQDPDLTLIEETRILSIFLGFSSDGFTTGTMSFTTLEPEVTGEDTNRAGVIIGGWPAE